MLTSNSIVTFVPTKNPARAKPFYEGVLGMRFVSDDPFAMVFEAKDAMIRVVKMQDFTPAPYTILGWEVADVSKTALALREKGITFERYPWMEQDEVGVWTTPDGNKVAWFKDPDGNVLSISQH